jgi:4-hydroxyphenylpyruvate dioxygenase
MKILAPGFDYVEFAVRDCAQHGKIYERLGFEKVGSRHLSARGLRSDLWQQGQVRILLTEPDLSSRASEGELVRQFLENHGEGICVLAVKVEDAKVAYETTLARGAKSARAIEVFESPKGKLRRAEIWTPASVRYAFIERADGLLFEEGLEVSRLESPASHGFLRIDHLTNNVGIGEMKTWVEFYQKIFGFKVTRHFDIRTGRTGLISDVVQSEDGLIIVPINEATEKASQIQEFVDRMKGAGVQHLALETRDLLQALRLMRGSGFKFLTVPSTYYEEVPKRVAGVTEDLKELEQLGILLDGEGEGYLLQIFSEEIVGPFFFEYIQRKGNRGFGEGNFRALFEAIERDQIRRGVLQA